MKIPSFAVCVVFVTFASLILNEPVGPVLIFLSLGLWAVYAVRRSSALISILIDLGPIPWLIPALALASVYWSPIPNVTFRAALELILTGFLTFFCVRAVRPSEFLNLFWIVSILVVFLSIAVNGHQYDGETGRIEATGLFQNKNTLAYISCCLVLSSISVVFERHRAVATRLFAAALILVGCAVAIRARSVAVLAVMTAASIVSLVFQFSAGLPEKVRRLYALIVLGTVAVGLIVAYLVTETFSAELLEAVGKNPTLTGRTLLWHYASVFYLSNPLLGRGLYGFWYQGQPEAEFLWSMEHIADRGGFHFHSIFWEVLIDLGEVGVVLAAITILAVVYRMVRWCVSDPGPISGFYLAILLTILILQTQAVDLFSPFGPYYFVFLTCFGYARTHARWRPAAERSYVPGSLSRRSTRQTRRILNPT